MTAIVLGGLCLVSALSWVVTAFFLPDLGTRVLLTLVSLALAGVVYVWARACVVVSQTAGTVVVRNPTRRVSVPLDQVDGFGVEWVYNAMQGQRKSTVVLRHTDGFYLPCAGMTAGNDRASVRMAGMLNKAVGRGNQQVTQWRRSPQTESMVARGRLRTPRKVRQWR